MALIDPTEADDAYFYKIADIEKKKKIKKTVFKKDYFDLKKIKKSNFFGFKYAKEGQGIYSVRIPYENGKFILNVEPFENYKIEDYTVSKTYTDYNEMLNDKILYGGVSIYEVYTNIDYFIFTQNASDVLFSK